MHPYYLNINRENLLKCTIQFGVVHLKKHGSERRQLQNTLTKFKWTSNYQGQLLKWTSLSVKCLWSPQWTQPRISLKHCDTLKNWYFHAKLVMGSILRLLGSNQAFLSWKNMLKTIFSFLIRLNMTMETKSYAPFLTVYVKEFQNDAIWDTP